jgi:hypothetical protein
VFTVLDAHAPVGRVFDAKDAAPRQVDTVILSYGFWQPASAGPPISSAAPFAWIISPTPSSASCRRGSSCTFMVVPVVIAMSAALACVGPARRAARIDPIRALRPD